MQVSGSEPKAKARRESIMGGVGAGSRCDGGEEGSRKCDGGEKESRRSDGGEEGSRRCDGWEKERRRCDGGKGAKGKRFLFSEAVSPSYCTHATLTGQGGGGGVPHGKPLMHLLYELGSR